MAGWMRQTTRLIRSTIEEKRSRLVYCLSATCSKSWSTSLGLRAFSMTPRAMTESGESWANRSKTSPRIIAVVGIISRRILLRGQFFPQFLRGQLEELPEAQIGQLHPQQAVRRLILATAGPKPAKVPVQTLQVE